MNYRKKVSNSLILILSWLIPGSGYYCLGKKWKGATIFILFLMTYLAGLAMSDFRNVSWEREPYYFTLQILSGSFTIISCILTSHLETIPQWNFYGYYLGCLYTCIPSFLNLWIIFKTYYLLDNRTFTGQILGTETE